MHSEDLLVNDCRDWETVEAIGECLPQLDIIPSLAFVVEAIDSVDRGTLVVSTQDEEVFRILDLVCQEQTDGLEGLLSSIYVITEEEVVCLWRKPTIFEQAEEIVVLAMNITADLEGEIESGSALQQNPSKCQWQTYLDRCFQFKQDWLRNEDFASLGA